jgi:regulator of cell morphogenesis and NO signaling
MDTTTSMKNQTVAQIVTDDFRTAEIFKKHGIDFCCGGKKSISQVCKEKHLDAEELEQEILILQNQVAERDHKFNEWKLSFLADYIVNVHHNYVNNNMELISGFADKVAKVHGHHNTETVEINELWKDVVSELTTHMKKEELVLFPYINNLERFSLGTLPEFPKTHFATVKSPVAMMEQEHEMVGELLHLIQVLSNNFTPPDYACNTYKVLYLKLNEFAEDLHQHIHLENNILFPKAIALEEKMDSYK